MQPPMQDPKMRNKISKAKRRSELYQKVGEEAEGIRKKTRKTMQTGGRERKWVKKRAREDNQKRKWKANTAPPSSLVCYNG